MFDRQMISAQLPFVLDETNFSNLGELYRGKVRDCYIRGKERVLIASDRLSCFDVVVTCVPFKGQVLSQMAAYWFGLTSHIVSNHVIDIPDPNVMIVHECEVIPIEVVVRAYLTGSAWRDYTAGKPVSGLTLPDGMARSQKLTDVIITPSTKVARGGHDQPVSESYILSTGVIEKKQWEEIKRISFELFQLGQSKAAERGLILVDTKYEFGLLNGKITLVDEIHTLDSSRYWIGETYQSRFLSDEDPEMLDKEPTRQWLLARGYKGDGEVPKFTDDHRVEIALHYIQSFEKITGQRFEGSVGDVKERIARNLGATR